MRKFFILLYVLLSLNVFSQGVVGIKGGLNISTISGNSSYSEPKLGFNAGLFGEKFLNEQLSLRTEFYYSRQGVKSYELKKRYDYILLPLILKVKISDVSFLFGSQAGTLFKAQLIDGSNKEIINASIENIDLSMLLGLEFELNESHSLGFRFTHGITSTENLDDSSFTPNVVFQLSLNKLIKK